MSPQESKSDKGEEKYDLERERIQLERDKLYVERIKAKWTAISIIIPLLAAIATISFGVWSQYQQSRSQFEIKATEIVMSSKSPYEALGKARALSSMFPDRLPHNFANSFHPEKLSQVGPGISEKKIELLRLVLENKDNREEVLRLWARLFPQDEWIGSLE